MNIEAFILDSNDYNKDIRRWSVSVLAIPNAQLVRLELDGQIVDARNYKVAGRFIDFVPSFSFTEESSMIAFIDVNVGKTKIHCP